jgi:hypothetical protein
VQEYAEAAQAKASPCYGRPRYVQKRIRSVTARVDLLCLICAGYLHLSTGFQHKLGLVIERVILQQT